MTNQKFPPGGVLEKRLSTESQVPPDSGFGLVEGERMVILRSLKADEIDQMDEVQLRAALHEINHAYRQTLIKVMQYRDYVPDEIKNRDPAVSLEIFLRLEGGLSDAQIATEIGESERFVQRERLGMTGGRYKRPRGRPSKSQGES